ncbi:MAG: hypothetical protein EB015_14870 [Methylocystaceae bacterium]|nr:hypothetical protein [Methylocystaceae bacterium]
MPAVWETLAWNDRARSGPQGSSEHAEKRESSHRGQYGSTGHAQLLTRPDLARKAGGFDLAQRSRLETVDTQACKVYQRSIISHIEVEDQKIRIIGNKRNLAGLITGKSSQQTNVRGFVRKWRVEENK